MAMPQSSVSQAHQNASKLSLFIVRIMSSTQIKLMAKGMVFLPKDVRKQLGLKKGDRLEIRVDEETRTILLQPSSSSLPKEIPTQDERPSLTSSSSKESKRESVTKNKNKKTRLSAKGNDH